MSRFFVKCFDYLPCQPYSEVDRISRQKFPETDYYKPTEDSNGVILVSEEALKIFEGTDEVNSYEEFEDKAKEGVKKLDINRNCCEGAPVMLMVSRQFFNSITPWQVTDRGFALQKREINLYLQCETFKFATRICVDCDSGDLPENYGEIDKETGKLYVVLESEATPLSQALDLLRPQLQKVETNLKNFNSIWASFPHLTNIDWQIDECEIEDFIDTFTKLLKHNKNPAFFASLIQTCSASLSDPAIPDDDPAIAGYEESLVTLVADIRRKKFLTFLQEKMINIIKNDPQHFEKCLSGFICFLAIDSFFASRQLAEWEPDDPGRRLNFPNDTKFEKDDPYLSEINFYHNKPFLSIQQLRPTPIVVLDPILDYLDAIVRNGDLHRLPFGAQQQIAFLYAFFSTVVLNTSEKRKDFILGARYDGGTLLKEMLQSLMKQFNHFVERNQSIPSELIDAIGRCFMVFCRFLGDRFWVENIPLPNSREHLPAMIQSGRKILAHYPFNEFKIFIQHLPSITHEDEYQIVDGQRLEVGLSSQTFKNLCNLFKFLAKYVFDFAGDATLDEVEVHSYNPLLMESGVIPAWCQIGNRCLPETKWDKSGEFCEIVGQYFDSISYFLEYPIRDYVTDVGVIRHWFVTKNGAWESLLLFCSQISKRIANQSATLTSESPLKFKNERLWLEQMIRNDFRKKAGKTIFFTSRRMYQFAFTTACKVYYLEKNQNIALIDEIEKVLGIARDMEFVITTSLERVPQEVYDENIPIVEAMWNDGKRASELLQFLVSSLSSAQQCLTLEEPPTKEQFCGDSGGTRRDREGDENSSAGN